MNTCPPKSYGSEPAPALTATVPISLADGHAPAFACGSGHSVTEGIAPSSPGGSVVCTCERYCCPSARARSSAKGLYAPALDGLCGGVLWTSEKGSGVG